MGFFKMEAIKQNRQSQESKHFTSLQIFTSYAEPALDEYLSRKEQQVLEQKQRDEEEDNITQMAEEERDVYLNQLTGEERSKNIKLTEKHCRQMMDLIYKKKMEYFKSESESEEWKEVLARSYPRDPPNIGK